MRDDQTFFVGVGAMRAGTSWLHNYLLGRDDVFVPKMKELHYFDVKFRPDLNKGRGKRIYADVAESVQAHLDCVSDHDQTLMWEHVDRLAMQRNPSAYRDFFLSRLKPQHKVFGEITPAYSTIGDAGMAAIKKQFPSTKVIWLLRDPVSRFVSQVSYIESSKSMDAGMVHPRAIQKTHFYDKWRSPLFDANLVQRQNLPSGAYHHICDSLLFDACLRNPGFWHRGAYHEIWQSLSSVFDEENIYVGFYEMLFTDEGVAEICDFLGLPFKPAKYGKRINRANSPYKITPQQELRARHAFKAVYDFCEEKFGDKLPKSWLSRG